MNCTLSLIVHLNYLVNLSFQSSVRPFDVQQHPNPPRHPPSHSGGGKSDSEQHQRELRRPESRATSRSGSGFSPRQRHEPLKSDFHIKSRDSLEKDEQRGGERTVPTAKHARPSPPIQ